LDEFHEKGMPLLPLWRSCWLNDEGEKDGSLWIFH